MHLYEPFPFIPWQSSFLKSVLSFLKNWEQGRQESLRSSTHELLQVKSIDFNYDFPLLFHSIYVCSHYSVFHVNVHLFIYYEQQIYCSAALWILQGTSQIDNKADFSRWLLAHDSSTSKSSRTMGWIPSSHG